MFQKTLGLSCPDTFCPGFRAVSLSRISTHDGPKQTRKSCVYFGTAGAVEYLHTAVLAANQTCFAQDADVLGQRGFRNWFGEQLLEGRTIGCTLLPDDLGVDGYACRIGEGVQHASTVMSCIAGWRKERMRVLGRLEAATNSPTAHKARTIASSASIPHLFRKQAACPIERAADISDQTEDSMGKLDGKVAVITAATSGMVLATAKLFVNEGASWTKQLP